MSALQAAGPATIPGPRLRSTPTDLAPQQAEAVRKVRDWHRDPRGPQVFRLFGYAGTGKTTVAKDIVAALGLSVVLYAAYTGKAAHVLQTKGCDGARTVHSLIYTPRAACEAKLRALEEQLEALGDADETDDGTTRRYLLVAIKHEQARLDEPEFILREESELEGADLLILDEASMIPERMAKDLLSFGAKVLVLGDPAQLPPVKGAAHFINAQPDHLLTEIHRSAADSPVTRIATAVRNAPEGDRLLGVPYGADGDSGRARRLRFAGVVKFDQVLCWKNATRWDLIRRVRAEHGLHGDTPQPGDRIIFTANNGVIGVLNGQQAVIESATDVDDRPEVVRVTAETDDGVRTLDLYRSGFTGQLGEKEATRRGRSGKVAAATFGQAITVHKAQGSQWDHVLVVEESDGLAAMKFQSNRDVMGDAAARIEAHVESRRWLYTAVTRAAQRVVIVSKGALA